MRKDAFHDALESARELRDAREGKIPAYRETVIEVPDVAEIREKSGLSQSEFASVMGISVRTLQDWEQGRRTPQGPARSLLAVTRHDPKAVIAGVKAAAVTKKPRKGTAIAPRKKGRGKANQA